MDPDVAAFVARFRLPQGTGRGLLTEQAGAARKLLPRASQIVEAACDGGSAERVAAARALEALLAALPSSEAAEAYRASRAFRLREALGWADKTPVMTAVAVLGFSGDVQAIEVLVEQARREPWLFKCASEAVERIVALRGAAAAGRHRRHPHRGPGRRQRIPRPLAEKGISDRIGSHGELEKALGDPHPDVVTAARRALAQLDGPDAAQSSRPEKKAAGPVSSLGTTKRAHLASVTHCGTCRSTIVPLSRLPGE